MNKIVTVVGARPQFVKAAVVSRILRANEGVREVIIHTGQHFDTNMSSVFFDELDIPEPDYNLGIGGGTHGQNTGRMIEAIEQVLVKEKPDWVLVYGDTDSTLAGAIAAVKLNLRLAHVEAGLRSFNRCMPEEINRVLTDHAANLLFAPTMAAVANLSKEGIVGDRVQQVGDVMYDAVLYYADKAQRKSEILNRLGVDPGRYILATIHRQENTDNREKLACIIDALIDAAKAMPVLLPVHPRTRHALKTAGLLENSSERLRLIEPVGYLDMVMLERHAWCITTDSGGVQKEAYFFGVPCLTLRDETEWVETVESGWNTLAGSKPSGLVDMAQTIATRGTERPNYFGDGEAAERIVACLSAC